MRKNKGTLRKSLISSLLLSILLGCGGGGSTPPLSSGGSASSGGSTSSGGNPSPTLMSITITPANPTISVRAFEQFTASGTYSDGSIQNLTKGVTWSSSAPAVATIQTTGQATPGLASATEAGTATITANSDGVSG